MNECFWYFADFMINYTISTCRTFAHTFGLDYICFNESFSDLKEDKTWISV